MAIGQKKGLTGLGWATVLFSLFLFIDVTNGAPQSSKDKNKGRVGNSHSISLNEKGVQAMNARDLESAERFFRDAVATDPANLAAIFNLSGVYIANKKEQQAIHLLQDTINRFEGDAGLYSRLGDAYFSSKDPKKAVENYEKAFSLEPDYPALARRMATTYVLLNKLKKAEELFLIAVNQNAQDAASLSGLAAVYLANKKPQDSIRAAKNSLQHEVSKDTYITLGSAYEMLRDKGNALIAFEKALALDATNDEIRDKVKELKKVNEG